MQKKNVAIKISTCIQKAMIVVVWVLICLYAIPVRAQYSMGTTGMLRVPTADMQADGTFMVGGNFLPKQMMPAAWDYHTGNYFVNITFLPFVEVAYRCTFLRGEYKEGNQWQQDRAVSLRLRPLKEGRWWPAIVVGSNDAFTTNQLNPFKDPGGTRYFSSVFLVGTKHIPLRNHDIAVTIGGHVPFRAKSENRGLFGGISYSPAFYREGRVMVEYDSDVVNVGVAARLFRHVSLNLFCYDFRAVSAGLRYEVKLF